jgi:hypothetical protein
MQAARRRAHAVAAALEIRGVARVDAFLDVSDGALYVFDVNVSPPLLPGSPLFQQALLEDPPIYPAEFCRQQVVIALEDDEPENLDFADEGDKSGEEADNHNLGEYMPGAGTFREEDEEEEDPLSRDEFGWAERT